MTQKLLQQILHRIARMGSDPNDSDEMRLQKTLAALGSFLFIAAGTLWGFIYFSLGEYIAGVIPLGYAIISSLSLIVFI